MIRSNLSGGITNIDTLASISTAYTSQAYTFTKNYKAVFVTVEYASSGYITGTRSLQIDGQSIPTINDNFSLYGIDTAYAENISANSVLTIPQVADQTGIKVSLYGVE